MKVSDYLHTPKKFNRTLCSNFFYGLPFTFQPFSPLSILTCGPGHLKYSFLSPSPSSAVGSAAAGRPSDFTERPALRLCRRARASALCSGGCAAWLATTGAGGPLDAGVRAGVEDVDERGVRVGSASERFTCFVA